MSNLLANWTAPKNVRALTTTRIGGQSLPPFDTNNLGLHVGDNADHVALNRLSLVHSLQLPKEPVWLEQTHSTHCVVVEDDNNRIADAAITRSHGLPLAIMTADCLPILLCNREGTEIAAIHAGWKGLVNGIVEQTLRKMRSSPDTLMAWIGPAICQRCYQVGSEVEETFLSHYSLALSAFKHHDGHSYANLPALAELILKAQNVPAVFHSGACTFEEKDKFYSYRRETKTGRMVSLIWLESHEQ